MNLAEAPLHLTSCTQQRSMCLEIVSSISLDLPVMVAMFHEAILSVLSGVSNDGSVTSVNKEQDCSWNKLRIVGNSNKNG